MITFSCPSCKQTLEVEDRGAGLIVPCPTCTQQVHIPWKVEPVAAAPSVSPMAYRPSSISEPDVPPVIHAGVLCLCAYAAVALIGLILFQAHLQTQLKTLREISTVT